MFHFEYNHPIYDNFEDLEFDQLELLFLQLHILSNQAAVSRGLLELELYLAQKHVTGSPKSIKKPNLPS